MSIPSCQGIYVSSHVVNYKCEFDENNPQLPCKRCISKRYACSEKSLGSKSQVVAENKSFEVPVSPSFSLEWPIGTPLDQLLLPNDSFYLQVYELIFLQGVGSREAVLFSVGSQRVLVNRLDFDITSRPYRAAILALASLACLDSIDYTKGGNPDTNSYCAIYYRAASEAVATRDVTTLMFASYIMAILNCLYEPCSWAVLVHCAQFCRTVHAYLEDQVSTTDCVWVIELWYPVVYAAYERYWAGRNLELFGRLFHPVGKRDRSNRSFTCSTTMTYFSSVDS